MIFIINSILELIKKNEQMTPADKCIIYYFLLPYFIDIGEYIMKYNIQDKTKLPSWMCKCGIIWNFCLHP